MKGACLFPDRQDCVERMSALKQLRNTSKNAYAVVTGASSGIGMAFAAKLASLGFNLILIARSEEKLNEVADELIETHQIHAVVLPADLSKTEDVASVEMNLRKYDEIAVLVNSAGFALRKRFVEQDLEKQLSMISLHINAGTRLTKVVLPSMIGHGKGFIVNVSSLLSLMDLSNNSVHCATKAYLNRFSVNLQREVGEHNIKVQALNAGYTLTNFHNTPEFFGVEKKYTKMFIMSPENLVNQSLAALSGNKVIFVPGLANKLLVKFRFLFSPILRKSLASSSMEASSPAASN